MKEKDIAGDKDQKKKVSLVDLYKDMGKDMREQRRLTGRLMTLLIVTLILAIAACFGISIWNQKMMKDLASTTTDKFIDFMNEFEFYSEVELTTENDSENYGSINIGK